MTRSVNAASVLAAAVATAGTFTVPYPAGKVAGDFAGAGALHKLSALQVVWEAPRDFTIAFGAASATVTWKAATTLRAGTSVRVEFDEGGENVAKEFADVLKSGASARSRVVLSRSVPAVARVIDFGSPVALDDDALFASAAIAGAGAVVLIAAGQTFDVARNVYWTSAGDSSAITATVVGLDEYGQLQTEDITGPNATVAQGVKAFKSIASITMSGACTGNQKLGFGNKFGFPIHIPSTACVIYSLQDGAVPANAPTITAGLLPLTKPTKITADERGLFAPNTNAANVPDGARGYSVCVVVPNPSFVGSQPYAA